jgi:hypothetical protein
VGRNQLKVLVLPFPFFYTWQDFAFILHDFTLCRIALLLSFRYLLGREEINELP